MRRPTVLWVLGAVLVAATLYGFGRWDGASAARDAASIADARRALAIGAPHRTRRAMLLQREAAALAAASRERDRRIAVDASLAAAKAELATLEAAGVAVPAAARRVIELGAEALASCRTETESLTLAVAACRARAAADSLRVDSLEVHLERVISLKDCRFLFFRCPSRTTVALVAGVIGAAGGFYLATQKP